MNVNAQILSFASELGKALNCDVKVLTVRNIPVTNLNELPLGILEQLLESSVQNENFEISAVIRDAIKSKQNG